MPVLKTQLHFQAKGSLAEREDWWWLCYDTDVALFHVEHEWDHMDPYDIGKASDKGSVRLTLEQWEARGSPGLSTFEAARVKLLSESSQ